MRQQHASDILYLHGQLSLFKFATDPQWNLCSEKISSKQQILACIVIVLWRKDQLLLAAANMEGSSLAHNHGTPHRSGPFRKPDCKPNTRCLFRSNLNGWIETHISQLGQHRYKRCLGVRPTDWSSMMAPMIWSSSRHLQSGSKAEMQ